MGLPSYAHLSQNYVAKGKSLSLTIKTIIKNITFLHEIEVRVLGGRKLPLMASTWAARVNKRTVAGSLNAWSEMPRWADTSSSWFSCHSPKRAAKSIVTQGRHSTVSLEGLLGDKNHGSHWNKVRRFIKFHEMKQGFFFFFFLRMRSTEVITRL